MPTVSEMRRGSRPEYPPSGCRQCDGIRRIRGQPDVWCLVHDPNIPAEERKRHGIAFERLVTGDFALNNPDSGADSNAKNQ
jgi:hypothetical protein